MLRLATIGKHDGEVQMSARPRPTQSELLDEDLSFLNPSVETPAIRLADLKKDQFPSGRPSLGNLDPLGRLGRLDPLAFARYLITFSAIGVFRHHLHGVGAVGLEDAHRPSRADAMAVKKHKDFAHDLLLAQAAVIRLARTGPMPSTSHRRSGSASMTSNTLSPKTRTSFLA